MASARLTARRVRRSSPSLTSPKVACAHVFGDITALHSSISLSFRFTLLSQFYHFFTRTMWEQVRCLSWWLRGATRSHPNQDKHQAPSSTPPHPLSLQDPGPQAPQWIGFPDSVVNIQ